MKFEPVSRPESTFAKKYREQTPIRNMYTEGISTKLMKNDSPDFDISAFSPAGYKVAADRVNRLVQMSDNPEEETEKLQIASYLGSKTTYSPEYIYRNPNKVLNEVAGYDMSLDVRKNWDYFTSTVKYTGEANKAYAEFEQRGDQITKAKVSEEERTEMYDLLRKDITTFTNSQPDFNKVKNWIPQTFLDGFAQTMPYMGKAFAGNIAGRILGVGLSALIPAAAPAIMTAQFISNWAGRLGSMFAVKPLLNASGYVDRLMMQNENGEYMDPSLANWGSELSSWAEAAVESLAFDVFAPWIGGLFTKTGGSALVNGSVSRVLKASALNYVKGVAAESAEEGLQAIVRDVTDNIIKTIDTNANGRKWDKVAFGQVMDNSAKEFLRSVPTMAFLGLISGGIGTGIEISRVGNTQKYDADVHFSGEANVVPVSTVLFEENEYDKDIVGTQIKEARSGKTKLDPVKVYKVGDVLDTPVYRAVGSQAELQALKERGVQNVRIQEVSKDDYIAPLAKENYQELYDMVNKAALDAGMLVETIDGRGVVIASDRKSLQSLRLNKSIPFSTLTKVEDFIGVSNNFGMHVLDLGVGVFGGEGSVQALTEATHAVRDLMYGRALENLITEMESTGEAVISGKLRVILKEVYENAHKTDEVYNATTVAQNKAEEIKQILDTINGSYDSLSDVKVSLKKKPNIKKFRINSAAKDYDEIIDKAPYEMDIDEFKEAQKNKDTAATNQENSIKKNKQQKAENEFKKDPPAVNNEKVEKVTARIIELDKRAGTNTKIITDGRDLPPHVQKDAMSLGLTPGVIRGTYDHSTKTVYINATTVKTNDNWKDLDSLWVHEWAAHGGLRMLLGDDFQSEMTKFFDAVGEKTIRETIKDAYWSNTDENNKAYIADEYFAAMAEKFQRDGKIELSLMEKIKNFIRTILKKLGITSTTDADIKALLSQAYSALNQNTVTDTDGTRFQVDNNVERPRFQIAPPTDSKAFNKWFGDSKVVDESGKPLVVYHGTNERFTVFDTNAGKNTERYHGSAALGTFFTKDALIASIYADKDSANIIPVYLSLQNPYLIEVPEIMALNTTKKAISFRKKLIRSGYDGIIQKSFSGLKEDEMSQIVAFYPTQIKSVNNSGAFSPDNADIRFQTTTNDEVSQAMLSDANENIKELESREEPKTDGKLLDIIKRQRIALRETLERLKSGAETKTARWTNKSRTQIAAIHPYTKGDNYKYQVSFFDDRGPYGDRPIKEAKDINKALMEYQLTYPLAPGKRLQLGDIRFQLSPPTDSTAFKNWFGDSKVVDEEGKPLVVYYGTNESFNEFLHNKIGDHGSALGKGFYFALDRATASGYSRDGAVMEVYLNINNPIPINMKGFSRKNLGLIISRIVKLEVEQYEDLADYKDGFLSNYVNTYEMSEASAIREVASLIYDEGDSAVDNMGELANATGDRGLLVSRAVKDTLGYDGFIDKNFQEGETVYVAWESNQVKSVENQGTFDPTNPDIRYQLRDLFDDKDIDSYDGVEYVKHDEGYNYDKEDLKRIDENVQEQLDLFGIEETDSLFRKPFDDNRSVPTIRKDWKSTKRVDFTGTVVQSPQAVAELFSIYRNPELEFFHIIYIDDNGEILAHNAMSSGLPGSTIAAETGVPGKLEYNMKSRMKRLGATGYYLMHNHPSGNIDQSRPDINITKRYAADVPGLKGHIILDHTQFKLLYEREGNIEWLPISYDPNKIDARKLEKDIMLQPKQLAEHLSDTITQENKSVYIIVDSYFKAIETRPIKTPSFKSAYEAMRSVNGRYVMLGTTNRAHFEDMVAEAHTTQDSKYGVMRDIMHIDKEGEATSYMELGGKEPLWEEYAGRSQFSSSTSRFVWENNIRFSFSDNPIQTLFEEGYMVPDEILEPYKDSVWAKKSKERNELVKKYPELVNEAKDFKNLGEFIDFVRAMTPHKLSDNELEIIYKTQQIQPPSEAKQAFRETLMTDDGLQSILGDFNTGIITGELRKGGYVNSKASKGGLSDEDLQTVRNSILKNLETYYTDWLISQGTEEAIRQLEYESLLLALGVSVAENIDNMLLGSEKDSSVRKSIAPMIKDKSLREQFLNNELSVLDIDQRLSNDKEELSVLRKKLKTVLQDSKQYQRVYINISNKLREYDAIQNKRAAVQKGVVAQHKKAVQDAVIRGLPVPDKNLEFYQNEEWAQKELAKRHTFRTYPWVLELAAEADTVEDLRQMINNRLDAEDDDFKVGKEFLAEAFRLGNAPDDEQIYASNFLERISSEDGLTSFLQEIVDNRDDFYGVGLPRAIFSAVTKHENGKLTTKDRDNLRASISKQVRRSSRAYYIGKGDQGAISTFRSDDVLEIKTDIEAGISAADRVKIANIAEDQELKDTIMRGDFSLTQINQYQRKYDNEIEKLLNEQEKLDVKIEDLQQKHNDAQEDLFISNSEIKQLRREVRVLDKSGSIDQALLKRKLIEDKQKYEDELLERTESFNERMTALREQRDKKIKEQRAELASMYANREAVRKAREKMKFWFTRVQRRVPPGTVDYSFGKKLEILTGLFSKKFRIEGLISENYSKQIDKLLETKDTEGAIRKDISNFITGEKVKNRFLKKEITLVEIDALFKDDLQKLRKLRSKVRAIYRADKLMNIMENFNEYTTKEFPDVVAELNDLRMEEFTYDQLDELYYKTEQLRSDGRNILYQKNLSQKIMRQNVSRDIAKEILRGDSLELFEAIGSKETKEKQKSSAAFRVWAATLRPTRMIDKLGGKVMNDWFVEKVNKATDAEIVQWHRRHEAGLKKMEELKLTLKNLSRQITSNGFTFSADEVIHIQIGMLNEKSKAALVYGNAIKPEIIQGLTSQLTENESLWGDYMLQDFEAEYERLNKAFIRDKNVDMGKEKAYFPMMRQDLESKDLGIGDEMGQQFAVRNAWRKGYAEKKFTLGRINMADEHQVPIRLGATAIWLEQIDKQEHYINSQELIKDLQYIQNDQAIKDALKQKYGTKAALWLQKYVNDYASPNMYKTYTEGARVSRILRNNMAIAYLSFNMLTVLKQAPSLGFYLREAGPHHIMAAAFQMISHPLETIKMVESMDPQMMVRSYNRIQQELAKTDKNAYVNLMHKVGRVGMKPIMYTDKAVTTIGWLATYNAKIGKGMTEAEAARAAQRVTLETQPSGRAKDLAEAYREGEMQNWLLMFSNQLNQIFNMYAYDLPTAFKQHEWRKFSGIMAGIAISGMSIAFLGGWRPPEDEKDIPKEVALELMKNFMSAIPIVGNNIKAGFDNEYFMSGLEVVPAAISIGSLVGDVARWDIDKMAKDGGQVLKDAGITAGAPVTIINRSIKTVQNRDLLELLGYGFTQHRK